MVDLPPRSHRLPRLQAPQVSITSRLTAGSS